MYVLKFGGKSLATTEMRQLVVNLVQKININSRIALVCSAIGHTTSELNAAVELAVKGDSSCHQVVDKVVNAHHFESSERYPQKVLTYLHRLLDDISHKRAATEKDRTEILSTGELLSCFLMTRLLIERGIQAHFYDSRRFLVTEGKYHGGTVLTEMSRKNLNQLLPEGDGKVLVFTGFIANNRQGETTNLGFNGSDYSATLIANFLSAQEVQIWRDQDGIYPVDPAYMPQSHPIPHLSYEAAQQLATFGNKAIHHLSIGPLIDKRIPLRFKNIYFPHRPGTLVSSDKINSWGNIAVQFSSDAPLESQPHKTATIAIISSHPPELIKLSLFLRQAKITPTCFRKRSSAIEITIDAHQTQKTVKTLYQALTFNSHCTQ